MKEENGVQVVLLGLLAVLVIGGMVFADADSVGTREAVSGPFTFITESEVWDLNLAMSYPLVTTNVDEAKNKLEEVMADWPTDKMATLRINDGNQVLMLQKMAPLVDQVIVDPFAGSDEGRIDKDEAIWSDFDQPVINKLRGLRNRYSKRLLGLVDLAGEWSLFNRTASFEEFKWRVLALIGANYQGVVILGQPGNIEWIDQLKQFRMNLMEFAEDLGQAKVVHWASVSEGQPVSAIASEGKLFVVFLNPEYMVPCGCCNKVNLPAKPSIRKGTLKLELPQGVRILSGATLSAKPVKMKVGSQKVAVDYEYEGAGQMLVFEISKDFYYGYESMDSNGPYPR